MYVSVVSGAETTADRHLIGRIVLPDVLGFDKDCCWLLPVYFRQETEDSQRWFWTNAAEHDSQLGAAVSPEKLPVFFSNWHASDVQRTQQADTDGVDDFRRAYTAHLWYQARLWGNSIFSPMAKDFHSDLVVLTYGIIALGICASITVDAREILRPLSCRTFSSISKD